MAASLALGTLLVLFIPGWHRDTLRLRLAVTEDSNRLSYLGPGIPLIVSEDAKVSLHVDKEARIGLKTNGAELKLAKNQTVKLDPGSLAALGSIEQSLQAVKGCLEKLDDNSCKGLATKIERIVVSIQRLSPERSPQKER